MYYNRNEIFSMFYIYIVFFRNDAAFEGLKQQLKDVMHRTAGIEGVAAANTIEGSTPISATTSIQKSAPLMPMPNIQDTSSTLTMSEPPKGHPATISHSVSVEQTAVQPAVETTKRKDEA